MKFLLAAIVLLNFFPIETHDNNLARVNKLSGKYVFYYNEPVEDYETVFTFTSSFPNQAGCYTVDAIADVCMKSAMFEAGAQGRAFDGIVIGSGQRDMAIKFKNESKDNSIARVNKIQGKSYFLFCEPLNNYKVQEKIKVFRVDQWTGACLSNNQVIEKVQKQAEKSLGKQNLEYDALIIGNDQFHSAIKFE